MSNERFYPPHPKPERRFSALSPNDERNTEQISTDRLRKIGDAPLHRVVERPEPFTDSQEVQMFRIPELPSDVNAQRNWNGGQTPIDTGKSGPNRQTGAKGLNADRYRK